jgi:hypothetical protein
MAERRDDAERSRENPTGPPAGTGVPCAEGQADGVPCDELKPDCEDCERVTGSEATGAWG